MGEGSSGKPWKTWMKQYSIALDQLNSERSNPDENNKKKTSKTQLKSTTLMKITSKSWKY